MCIIYVIRLPILQPKQDRGKYKVYFHQFCDALLFSWSGSEDGDVQFRAVVRKRALLSNSIVPSASISYTATQYSPPSRSSMQPVTFKLSSLSILRPVVLVVTESWFPSRLIKQPWELVPCAKMQVMQMELWRLSSEISAPCTPYVPTRVCMRCCVSVHQIGIHWGVTMSNCLY